MPASTNVNSLDKKVILRGLRDGTGGDFDGQRRGGTAFLYR
jgi:hypothetical protein